MSFQLAQKADSRNAATQVSCTRFYLLIRNIEIQQSRLDANSWHLKKVDLLARISSYCISVHLWFGLPG